MNQLLAAEAAIVRAVCAVPGLSLIPAEAGNDHGIDGELEFSGTRQQIAVQIKSRASAATAWQIVHEYAGVDRPLVLIAAESTADARRILREHGIGLIDGLGNAHIQLPGLLVHVEAGQSGSYARPVRLSGKAGS